LRRYSKTVSRPSPAPMRLVAIRRNDSGGNRRASTHSTSNVFSRTLEIRSLTSRTI
jgi:hypothetical protein